MVKHGLRGALTPIVTIFGLDFGLLIGGAVLTEKVFSLNGLGKYAIDGIVSNDLPKVLGVTLLAALFVIICQPDRRPALRRGRPESADQVTLTDDYERAAPRRAPAPSSRCATSACTSRPTTAW